MTEAPWSRAIILVDMNAFFAAVEQLDNPGLQAKPIAITNGKQGSGIITCSYEARAYGVKTGMRVRDAYARCPELRVVASRPRRYMEISSKIMAALAEQISPDIEIFSVDEAFLDVTYCQSLLGTPAEIAWRAKQLVYEVSGLSCSVGVSGDKTTAKFAAKCQKPNGFTVIHPSAAADRLCYVAVDELCGIADGIRNFLARYGVRYCGDMKHVPISILAKRFGNLGRRIWYMCQGADPEPLRLQVALPKTMGHGKVLPPRTKELEVVRVYLRHMSEKLAARLRANTMQAQHFYIGIRTGMLGWLGEKCQLVLPTADGKAIYQAGLPIITKAMQLAPADQIQVTALDPHPKGGQLDFFASQSGREESLHRVIDAINQRYGSLTVLPAPLLLRSQMNDVIAPAWQPGGPRQSL